MDIDPLIEEAIPLIAEDLKQARRRLGLTSAKAAKRAQLDARRYRAIEASRITKSTYNIGQIISVAQRLGLDSIRVSYVDEVDQYMQVDIKDNEAPTIFVDALDSDLSQLREQGHFVSPRRVLTFVDQAGIGSMLGSRNRTDKMLVELWVTAILTTCLSDDRDYYIRPTNVDAPDTEVALVDRRSNAIIGTRWVEITQHGSHSISVFDVIGKKLRKRYQDGTILLVLVEESQKLPVAELYELVRKNNPHGQQIFIIGGTGGPGKFKVVPFDDVASPTTDDISWSEMIVDTDGEDSRGGRYEGVVFNPRYKSRFRPLFPIFIKTVGLRR
ncbi:MAG: hypothetical protein OXC69_06870 [Candidatus Tectomicrobia bacterium]|nr:hypothetical protein [Candidatus Tectomicrobia bacterium]